MRHLIISIFLLNLVLSVSCKKENTAGNQEGYIHPITTEIDMAVMASFEIENGNYLVIGRDFLEQQPGLVVKLDKNGQVIFKKSLSPLNKVMWKVLPLPGKGFATLGPDVNGARAMTACLYDNDGNLTLTSNINTPDQDGWSVIAPYDFIQLKNGNFVISGYVNQSLIFPVNSGYLMFTNNLFDTLFTRTYVWPDTNVAAYGGNVCDLIEMPDNSIAISAVAIEQTGVNQENIANTWLIKTDPSGNLLSKTPLVDPLNSETPNCIIAKDNGILCVAGKMKGTNDGDGVYVNYHNNNNFQYISGSINLCSFTTDGQFVNRKKISSYAGNGMISSIKQTADGGFILCGTVNQNNSNLLVSNTKIYLLKLDAGLNEQWSKTFNTTYQSFGVDAFQSADGGYLVSGHERTFNNMYNMLVIKTDASGNVY